MLMLKCGGPAEGNRERVVLKLSLFALEIADKYTRQCTLIVSSFHHPTTYIFWLKLFSGILKKIWGLEAWREGERSPLSESHLARMRPFLMTFLQPSCQFV